MNKISRLYFTQDIINSDENTIRWWLSKCARHIIKCNSCEYTCTIYNIYHMEI